MRTQTAVQRLWVVAALELAVLVAGVVVAALGFPSHHAAPPTTGMQCFPITTTWNDDGSVTQSWTDERGNPTTYRIPPRGFNVLKATNAQLARFNIPPRPTKPSALSDWTAEWAHSRLTPIGGICTGNVVSGPPPLHAVK
jgi:hypothetical protein